jgi:hypothetical protein
MLSREVVILEFLIDPQSAVSTISTGLLGDALIVLPNLEDGELQLWLLG